MKRDAMARLVRTLAQADRSALSDRELLARYAADGDQSAFAAIVSRHTAMVLGVCRRALANQQDAEDACQATFLLLAKRAKSLRWQPSAANWLYAAARKMARNARVKARRRTKREQAAAVPDAIAPFDQMTGQELLAILDEELERLPPRYREPLVLCYLEGLTRDEAATRLGIPEATLKSQLERGRGKLARALTGRGCTLGIALLTTVAADAARATAPQFLDSILAAANGSPSPAAAALTNGAVMNGILLPTKIGAFVIAGISAIGIAAFTRPAVGQPAPKLPTLQMPIELVAAPVRPADNKASQEALDQAAKILNQIVKDEPNARCRLWCEMADLRGKLGDRDGAFAALGKARDAADELKGGDNAALYNEWRGIGKGYAGLGDAKTVTDFATAVPEKILRNGRPRDMILQESAGAAAEAGHAKAAGDILAALSDEEQKKWVAAKVMRLLILHRADSGDMSGAIKAVDELATPEEKVLALAGPDYLNLNFDDEPVNHKKDGIVSIQLTRGDRAGAKASALKALGLIPDVEKPQRARAATTVVYVLCKLDDLPSARKAMDLIPPKPDNDAAGAKAGLHHWWDLKAKSYLAAAEVRAGNDKAAIALAKDFSKPDEQAYIFQFAAAAQVRTGRLEAAKATFSRAQELASDLGFVHVLMSAQALAGDFEGATETAKKLPITQRDSLWDALVSGHAQNGDFAAAREDAAHQLSAGDQWSYCTSLQYIAELQAKSGKPDAAREWAEKESDPLAKAHALFGIAEGLFREDTAKSAGK